MHSLSKISAPTILKSGVQIITIMLLTVLTSKMLEEFGEAKSSNSVNTNNP